MTPHTDITTMPWDDSGLHAVARLPMHSLRCPAEIELDGDWDFQLLSGPTAPVGDSWEPVAVPSLWTMREAARGSAATAATAAAAVDGPHYTNVTMPFREIPPTVPIGNPTGVYRRSFDLNPIGDGRAILHVGAAEGLLRVFVNGHAVGISTDSHLAAEFDITDACGPGSNTVELVVSKWSSATYVEDQDQWWQSGISRSVFLYTVPQIRLSDVSAVADFDPQTQRGELRVEVSTSGLAQLSNLDWSVQVEVLGQTATVAVAPRIPELTLPDQQGDRSVEPQPLPFPDDFMDVLSIITADAPVPEHLQSVVDKFGSGFFTPPPNAGTATLTLESLDVEPWSAETPHLEDLVVRLVSSDGRPQMRSEPGSDSGGCASRDGICYSMAGES